MKKARQIVAVGRPWKRFDVELFIIHPSMKPSEITASLGLRAKFKHQVGDRRRTPTGRLLEGTYRDTRWRYTRRCRTKGQWFRDKVDALVDQLEQHKPFLRKLRRTGGRTCIVVQLLGDGYFGDQISRETLKRMADLDLDFGLESYLDRQSA